MKHLSLLLTISLALFSLIGCVNHTHQSTGHPTRQQGPQETWTDYRARSEAIARIDREFLAAELRQLGKSQAQKPPATKEFGFDIEQPDDWFFSEEGQRILEIILSFQTPSGGWSKRTDMASIQRQPGMDFGVEAKYVPTFDNGATTTQLRLLARAYALTGRDAYRSAFEQGLSLVLAAQYPNGGWPQNYPLVGGYHDYITYNDELMEDILSLLLAVSRGTGEFAFVSDDWRSKAGQSLERGLQCVLNTQVIVDEQRTIWGAQHDPYTLAPAKARAYEMAALSSTESVALVNFLMELPDPSAPMIAAIHDAMAWYQQTRILGYTWKRGDGAPTADASAPPMWARFYEIGTNLPLFGDRDHSVHYDISQVSQERREGYAWYSTLPNRVLEKYADWAKRFPRVPTHY